MNGATVDKIYYELRAQHRRKIAQFALELTLFAFIFYEMSKLLAGSFVLGLSYATGFGAVLAFAWMFADRNPGRVRDLLESIAGAQDWPADMKQELGEGKS